MSLVPRINFPINLYFWEGGSPSSKETEGKRKEKWEKRREEEGKQAKEKGRVREGKQGPHHS